jgi:hypothetical protein
VSPRFERAALTDGSFVEGTIETITPDRWRPHGVRYRLAWVQGGRCRVLFDNHHGKGDHFHIDQREYPYRFRSVGQLIRDFQAEIRNLGGRI